MAWVGGEATWTAGYGLLVLKKKKRKKVFVRACTLHTAPLMKQVGQTSLIYDRHLCQLQCRRKRAKVIRSVELILCCFRWKIYRIFGVVICMQDQHGDALHLFVFLGERERAFYGLGGFQVSRTAK